MSPGEHHHSTDELDQCERAPLGLFRVNPEKSFHGPTFSLSNGPAASIETGEALPGGAVLFTWVRGWLYKQTEQLLFSEAGLVRCKSEYFLSLSRHLTTMPCLAADNLMQSEKGSFSYQQDNVTYLDLDGNLTIRIERINNDVARVFLVDAQQVQQPVPASVVMMDAAGVAVPPFLDNFLITWANSYTLSMNGQPHMILTSQKQQAIKGPTNAASGIL